MRRGAVVIIAQKGAYEGKPRPAVVIQANALLADHPSILVCLLTADQSGPTEVFYRIPNLTHQIKWSQVALYLDD